MAIASCSLLFKFRSPNLKPTPQETAKKIGDFLAKYAATRPDYDPLFDDEDEQFTSPDASILFAAKDLLEKGQPLPKDFSIQSSWGSGGYRPYNDPIGKEIHDNLVAECLCHKL
jgi:hypothetical protein